MFVVIGASLAGLYLILKELFPLLSAWRTGVIRTKGANPRRVERAVEPERFRALCRNRINGMGLGLLAIAFGLTWMVFGLLALIPAAIVSILLAGRKRRPKRDPRATADEFS